MAVVRRGSAVIVALLVFVLSTAVASAQYPSPSPYPTYPYSSSAYGYDPYGYNYGGYGAGYPYSGYSGYPYSSYAGYPNSGGYPYGGYSGYPYGSYGGYGGYPYGASGYAPPRTAPLRGRRPTVRLMHPTPHMAPHPRTGCPLAPPRPMARAASRRRRSGRWSATPSSPAGPSSTTSGTFQVTASQASPTQVTLAWTAVPGATSYTVWQGVNGAPLAMTTWPVPPPRPR